MPPKQASGSSGIRVGIRVRPFNKNELQDKAMREVAARVRPGSKVVPTIEVTDKGVQPLDEGKDFTKPGTTPFGFDHVWWSVPEEQWEQRHADPPAIASQETVFNAFGQAALKSVFGAFNVCIFAYGQTGSGKTHTMMGSEEDPGLIPRLCTGLFAGIEAESEPSSPTAGQGEGSAFHRTPSTTGTKKFAVTISYVEVYNEKARDLLVDPTRRKSVKGGKKDKDASPKFESMEPQEPPSLTLVQTDDGFACKDATWREVRNFGEIKEALDKGNENRTVAATLMNADSSRSHAVLQIKVDITEKLGKGDKVVTKKGQSLLNLVDLAGSEKLDRTGVTGSHMTEAIGINSSLSVLGRVINALISKSPPPYRDSILTKLLKNSLGGNSRTFMVATISPAPPNYSETLNTLRFAAKSRKVVNITRANEDASGTLIKNLQQEILQLQELVTNSQADAKLSGELQQQLEEAESLKRELAEREEEEKIKIAEIEAREAQWISQRDEEVARREELEAKLEQEREAARIEREDLDATLRAQEESMKLLQLEFEGKSRENKEKMEILAANQAELENQRKMMEELEVEARRIEEEAETQRSAKEKQVQELEAQQEEHQAALRAKEGELQSLQGQAELLRGQQADQEAALAQRAAQVQELNSQTEAQKAELMEQESKLAATTDELHSLTTKVNETKALLQSREQEASDLKQRNTTLETRAAEGERVEQESVKNINEIYSTLDQQQQLISNLTAENQTLQQLFQEAEQNRTELEEKLEGMRKNTEAGSAMQKADLDSLKAERAQLEEEVSNMLKKQAEQGEVIKELELRLSEEASKKTVLRDKLIAMAKEKVSTPQERQRVEENSEVAAQVAELRHRLAEMESSLQEEQTKRELLRLQLTDKNITPVV